MKGIVPILASLLLISCTYEPDRGKTVRACPVDKKSEHTAVFSCQGKLFAERLVYFMEDNSGLELVSLYNVTEAKDAPTILVSFRNK